MADATPTQLTYNIVVGKKISDGNYGTDETSVMLQIDLPLGTDPVGEDAQIAIRNAVNAAKAQVAVSLGITTHLDDEGTLVYDVPEPKAIPAPAPRAATPTSPRSAVDAVTAAFPGATVSGEDAPPFINPARSSAEEKANIKWAKARFLSHPEEFFDNSQDKRNPRAPDVKHKKYNRNGGWDNDLVAWLS